MAKVEIDLIQYFRQNKGHGNNLIIKGGVGKGKTTLLALIVKLLLDYTNFVIVSNVRFHNEVFRKYPMRLFYVSNFRQYLDFYTKIPYSQPILLIIDDSQGNDSFTSKGVLTGGGKILASVMIYIRKLSTSMIYIAHQRYIPASIVDGFEPYYLYKTDKKDFVISQKFFEKDSESRNDIDSIIVEMPPFSEFDEHYLKILSHAFTDFEFNLDWDTLRQKLSQYNVGENLKECVADYLSDLELSETSEFNEYDYLKSLSYEKFYIGLCLKKGFIIPPSTKIDEIIHGTITKRGKDKIYKLNLINEIDI